jgi:NAD(P)-dependent dehydrogenase (short-subunit alcohol dehydrogenase family)
MDMNEKSAQYLQSLFGLEGKIAVITGGGGSIAGAMAEALIGAGATVSLWGRGKNTPMAGAARELEERLGLPSGSLHFATVDTSDKKASEEALEKTEAEAGMPKILINGVGGNIGKAPFLEMDMERFKTIVDMNLYGGLIIPTQVFASRWIEKGVKGSIINLASMASYTPLSGVSAYGAAKAAVMNLTKATARELAPRGIRVNGIAPGFFVGKQNRDLLYKKGTDELTPRGQSIIDRTPFKRFGDVEEISGAVVYLSSEKASGFVTGVTLPVDGGYLVDNI